MSQIFMQENEECCLCKHEYLCDRFCDPIEMELIDSAFSYKFKKIIEMLTQQCDMINSIKSE